MTLRNNITKLDFFGVPYMYTLPNGRRFYQTFVGGLITFLVYSLIIAYIIYIFYQWQDNYILPRITHQISKVQSKPFDNKEFNLAIKFFDINKNFQQAEHLNDTFNLILQPKYLQNSFKTFSYNNLIPNFTLNNGSDAILYFQEKNQEKLSTIFNESQITLVNISFNFYYFDIIDKQLKSVKKYYILTLDKNTTIFYQLKLKITHLEFDQGIIISEIAQLHFISDVEIVSQSTPITLLQKSFNLTAYLKLAFTINQISDQITIVYPKLGEILAEIGSIASSLMLLRLFVHYYNSYFLEEEVVRKLIYQIHPKYKHFQLKKNKKGSIIQVLDQNGKDLELNEFKKVDQKARRQLNIFNQFQQLYDLSKEIYKFQRQLLRIRRQKLFKFKGSKVKKVKKIGAKFIHCNCN